MTVSTVQANNQLGPVSKRKEHEHGKRHGRHKINEMTIRSPNHMAKVLSGIARTRKLT